MFYGSRNALWVARLIIDNVQCFLEAVQLIIRHFKLGESSAPQKKKFNHSHSSAVKRS